MQNNMKGLRFYRSSVASKAVNGLLFFYHGEIEKGRSDFDYIFRPLYEALSGKLILTDEMLIPYDVEHNEHQKYKPYIIQDNEFYYVFSAKILNICGKSIDEFEGNLLTVIKNEPKKRDWEKFSTQETNHDENIDCFLSNWDGIYWEIFSSNEGHFKCLLEEHKNDKNLEIYYVDSEIDYPEPKRCKDKLLRA